MCVYLAPRWRRRVVVLVLTLALLLRTADARTLRKLNVRPTTEHTDSEMPLAGKNPDDNELIIVGSNPNVGVVTTNLTQNLTAVSDKAWDSGSHRDDSHLSTHKSVSFKNLEKLQPPSLTTVDHVDHSKVLASKKSTSMDCEATAPCVGDGKTNGSDSKPSHGDTGKINTSFDKGTNNAGAGISSDIKLINDETTIQTGTTNKAAAPELVPPNILHSAPITHAPPIPSLAVGSFDRMTQEDLSSSLSEPSTDTKSDPIDDAEVLENKTKSAFSTTTNRSLDQTLVVVIIGVVGAIGTLVMVVSCKVLKEQDDGLDLEDSRFF